MLNWELTAGGASFLSVAWDFLVWDPLPATCLLGRKRSRQCPAQGNSADMNIWVMALGELAVERLVIHRKASDSRKRRDRLGSNNPDPVTSGLEKMSKWAGQ